MKKHPIRNRMLTPPTQGKLQPATLITSTEKLPKSDTPYRDKLDIIG